MKKKLLMFEECVKIKKELLLIMERGYDYSIHDLSACTGIGEIEILRTLNKFRLTFHIHVAPLNGINVDSVRYFI